MNILLVQPGSARLPHQPQTLFLRLEQPGRPGAQRADLLLLDVRRMTPLCLEAAFRDIARIRERLPIQLSAVLCTVPTLPLIVRCLRTGFREILHEPVSGRDLRRVLSKAAPGGKVTSQVVSAFLTHARGLIDLEKAPNQSPTSNKAASAELARRERQLAQRTDQLNHIQARLDLDRAALAAREEKLREATRRLEREMAAQQLAPEGGPPPAPPPRQSSSPLPTGRNTTHPPFPYNPPGTPPPQLPTSRGYTQPPFPTQTPAPNPAPLSAEMQLMLAQLNERTQALEIRERMLKEMEQLLTAHPACQGPGTKC